MASDDFARVVSALREPPFALRQISESDFASGDADRARRVARDAFHALAPFDEPAWAPSGDVDADDPPARASARLLVAFLAVVKYPPARDDAGALTRAFAPAADDDAEAAVDALKRAVRWAVEHREKCATRAHVAHHIADVSGSIPTEMRGYPEMAEALDESDRARRAYVAAHKRFEKNRKVNDQPEPSLSLSSDGTHHVNHGAAALTRSVTNLEDEKDSLTKKIEAVQKKIESRGVQGGDVDGRHLLSLAAAIREEKQNESETRRLAASAREKAEAADSRRKRAAVKLREILTSLGDETSGPLATLERLRAETERFRVEIAETLPESLETKRQRKQKLLDASDEKNLDEDALREWAGEVNALNSAVEQDARFVELKENEREDERDPAARQQASLAKSVRAKREAALASRDRLAARVKRAEDELRALESSGAGGSPEKAALLSVASVGATRVVPDEVEETTTGSSNDPATTATRRAYATLKPRLDDANAESATLARTAAILRDQLAEVLDGTRFDGSKTSDDADHAEKTSGASATKASLSASRFAELRERRAAFAALEQTYLERRRAFDAAVSVHRSGYEKLERETAALKNRVRGDETAFHATRIERLFVSVSAERLNGLNGDALARKHEGTLRDAQSKTETLRELDSNAGESAVGLTLDQMGALRDVHRLIETRLRVTREDAASGDAGVKRDGADVLSV